MRIGEIVNKKYQIINEIGEGGMSNVWLAREIETGRKVAVKVLKSTATSSRVEDIIRFRNEALTVSKIQDPHLVKIFEIGELENNHYIVMEYIEGQSLYKTLEGGKRFDIDFCVEIIYKICEALVHIHNSNIIHRDLKPGNIILQYDEKMEKEEIIIKVIDFGLAQIKELNMRETEEIIGTLCYMSPEQSGIIKRNVDERSDLYSLGIMFYQLLANELPFNGDNINTLIHQHIAKIPDKLIKFNSQIPSILENIVFKLIEKEPEKRYQSAEGLLGDLKKIKNGQQDFLLGLEDKIIKLNYRTNLVGRDEELKKLMSLFNDTIENKGSICLISGEAGKGKTRLVEELRNYVYSKRGVFVSGKCFSGENKVPYGPFKDIINEYVKQFNNYNENKKKVVRECVKNRLGDLGKVLLKLNPIAEEIIGTCPPVVELEPDIENKRFQMVVCQFFRALGEADSGIILMIDDLHWTDNATIELISTFSDDISKYQVLIIGTYRDNEVSERHILNKFITKDNSSNNVISQINLEFFDFYKMNSFVSKLLFDTAKNTKEISDFILQKSKGNPLFAIEILKQLVSSNIIIHKNTGWEIDNVALLNIEISSSIVDILIKKISGLSEKERYVISHAALVGRYFDINFLFSLIDLDKKEIVEIIDRAVEMQLLEQDLHERGKIFFAHDRIKEAFYKDMSDKKRKELHQKIGLMLETKSDESKELVIFDLAYHFIQAECADKICQYAYPAALKAKENYANEEAVEYLSLVKKTMEENNVNDKLSYFECLEKLGEVYLTIGKNDDAIKIFFKLLPNVNAKLDKVNKYKQIGDAYYKKGDWINCEKYIRMGMELLGEDLVLKRNLVIWGIFKEFLLKLSFSKLSLEPKIKKDQENTDDYKLLVRMYLLICWVYTLSDVLKFIRGEVRVVNIAERKIGKSKELAIGYMGYGSVLMAIPFYKQALIYYQKSLDLFKEYNDQHGIAECLQFTGYCHEWAGEFEKCSETFKQSVELFKRIGDIKQYSMTLNGLIHGYYYTSDYENMKKTNSIFYENAIKSKDIYLKSASLVYDIQYYREIGDYEKSEKCGKEDIELTLEEKEWFNYCSSNIETGITLIEMEDVDGAINCLEEAKKINEKNSFLKQYTVLLYPYLCEAYILKYTKNKANLSNSNKIELIKKIKKLNKDGLAKTKSWPTHYGNALRISAKCHALMGRKKDAERLYLQSIEYCLKHKKRYDQAKCLFEYAIFLDKNSRTDEVKEHFETAYTIFSEIGAKTYQEKSAKRLGISEELSNSTERFSRDIRYAQRLSTIINLSQDISSILDLNILLEKIMSITLEVTGARNGYLLMKSEKNDDINIVAQKKLGYGYKETDEITYEFSRNIVNEVLQKGKAILTYNAIEDDKYFNYHSVKYNQLKSILCIPIKYNNEITGACYLDNPLSASVFTEEDIDILNVILSQAAISIENAKLFKMAITDGLTNLITHKHFIYLLQTEISRARRYNRVFSFIMFDIDNFKKFNDTYGHQAGDEVLVKVSEVTTNLFRNTDVVARYGGEEFAILLTETNIEGALISAERLRQSIEDMEVIFENQKLKVTVSVGISTYPNHADNDFTIIKAADTALYTSKEYGRNMVTVFNSQL